MYRQVYMKIGKVPETVLKRSILKQVHNRRDEVIVGPGIGEDCAVLQLKEEETFIISTDPITGTKEDVGKLAVHITANDIASSGGELIGVMVTALLPPRTREAHIKQIMSNIEAECAKLNMQVLGGHTEITDAVNRPVLTVTGVGKGRKDKLFTEKNIKPNQDVVVSKWIGLEGTSILAKEKEEELLTRYPKHLIETAKGFDDYLSIVKEAATAVKSGVSAMHDVTEGGIFGALWEMAEGAGVGLKIDLKKIPLKQETVEICEFFRISPYELISSGSLLMITDKGHDLVAALEEEGIHAAVIGKTTDNNDRVVISGEESRFLEPPKTDELYKALGLNE